MQRRTDRKIALGGTAVVAVVLPTFMIVLSETGIGRTTSNNRPQAQTSPSESGPNLPSFGPAAQPSESPVTTPTYLPKNRSSSYPFDTEPGPRAPRGDPDDRKSEHGKKPHLPEGIGKLPTKFHKADDGAKITAVKRLGKSWLDLSIASPALGRVVQTRVIVPKTWSAGAKRSWPVVYAFHGGNSDYQSWTKHSDLAKVAAGYDLMIVMPEGGRNGSYTNWWNGGRGGIPAWETFHIREVIPLMERNFRAGSTRATIGLSSGAQGAMTYAVRYPTLFKYVAAYSGPLNITAPGMPAVLTQLNGTTAIWGDPVTDRANWRAHDPTVLVGRLRNVGVYVSSGNGEPGPYDKGGEPPWSAGRFGEQLTGRMTTNFVAAARREGIRVTANLYGPGMHNWPYWKRELRRSWPAVTAAIGVRKP
ncbi:alpha/beta hydrolase [Spirillospora sp. CA-294931]|uniref:alpha/beta hydrolase n=1 Tax=Spirillospora sp. CA-294931 TaxID=3240042 RepID=UPI003D93AF5B